MDISPFHPEIVRYLQKRRLGLKFQKQIRLFRQNPFHPSLNTELLEPRNLRIWSFRIDKKYRAIFIFKARDIIEIIDVNNHYHG
ncbi:MAG: type II toxin-antitoxin system YoeB family toxin [bacterium]|nr:type II toxin-antitoxin system YoeB family toxin [bacterium]